MLNEPTDVDDDIGELNNKGYQQKSPRTQPQSADSVKKHSKLVYPVSTPKNSLLSEPDDEDEEEYDDHISEPQVLQTVGSRNETNANLQNNTNLIENPNASPKRARPPKSKMSPYAPSTVKTLPLKQPSGDSRKRSTTTSPSNSSENTGSASPSINPPSKATSTPMLKRTATEGGNQPQSTSQSISSSSSQSLNEDSEQKNRLGALISPRMINTTGSSSLSSSTGASPKSRGRSSSSAPQNMNDEIRVFIWGDGSFGKLGQGSEKTEKLPAEIVQVNAHSINIQPNSNNTGNNLILQSASQQRFSMGACGSHNSILVRDDTIFMSGVGNSTYDSSLFGDSSQESILSVTQSNLSFRRSIKQIAVGNYHAIALTKGGLCYTWGWGGLGQLGHGDNANQLQPKLLQMKCIRQVAAGTKYSMIVTEFGDLYAFGGNQQGQLGVGHTEDQNAPCKVKRLSNVESVAGGISHTVAVVWGGNALSASGGFDLKNYNNTNNTNNNTTNNSSNNNNNNTNNKNYDDLKVYVWGQIRSGMIEPVPIEVKGLAGKPVVKVSCGEWHTLALTLDGYLYMWELGSEPTMRIELKGIPIRDISCGNFHSACIDDDGRLYTWGRGTSGQLGREIVVGSGGSGSSGGDPKIPTLVNFAPGTAPPSPTTTNPGPNQNQFYVRQVECGDHHSMAIIDTSPRRMLMWKLLKKERTYYRKLCILSDIYVENLIANLNDIVPVVPGNNSSNSETVTLLQSMKEWVDVLKFNVVDFKNLHFSLLRKLTETIPNQGAEEDINLDANTLGTTLRHKIHDFHVYLRYADAYNSVASGFAKCKRESDKLSAFLKEKHKLVLDQYSGPYTKSAAQFELKSLMFEPLKHIARYTKTIKKILKLTPRNHHDKEYLSWVYERFEGLLDRICKNFNLVNPLEILTCTLNEYGHPEISGANLSQLVERLTYHQFIDLEFTNAFLLTYRLFTTPEKFLKCLMNRYHFPSGSHRRRAETALTPKENENIKILVQIRVVQVLLSWVKSRVSSFDFTDPKSKLSEDVLGFVEIIKSHTTLAPQAITIEERIKKRDGGSITLGVSANNPLVTANGLGQPPLNMMEEDSDVNILDFDVNTIADFLCLWDFQYFQCINPQEFLKQAWAQKNSSEIAPNLLAFTNHFNQIGTWVVYEIVSRANNQKDRTNVVIHFLSVAKQLQKANNLNGMCAVMSGLNNSSVTRLKKTLQKLARSHQQLWDEMTSLVQGADNFRALREIWNKAEPPAIPFLGIHTYIHIIIVDDSLIFLQIDVSLLISCTKLT
eukprot:TRINITY_DN2925_c0_g4_i2.p1 TRINITY_DN2925_c0_g4~~TRINITY_DN2925_c0_g4_i2.p1  ORF type:complete len:1285 (-),score=312.73 TRINITY_DN2925_c0_g4_i2:27-3881(-)